MSQQACGVACCGVVAFLTEKTKMQCTIGCVIWPTAHLKPYANHWGYDSWTQHLEQTDTNEKKIFNLRFQILKCCTSSRSPRQCGQNKAVWLCLFSHSGLKVSHHCIFRQFVSNMLSWHNRRFARHLEWKRLHLSYHFFSVGCFSKSILHLPV